MAITQGLTTTFKEELLLGGHDFSTSGASAGTFAVSLHNAEAADAFDLAITQYSSTPGTVTGDTEITDTTGDYVTGGYNVANKLTVSNAPGNGGSGTVVFTSFSTKTFTSSTFTANCALIYNNAPAGNAASRTDPSVAVIDFNGDKSCSTGDFTIQFPTVDASNAIIRIN